MKKIVHPYSVSVSPDTNVKCRIITLINEGSLLKCKEIQHLVVLKDDNGQPSFTLQLEVSAIPRVLLLKLSAIFVSCGDKQRTVVFNILR